ncbi:histidine kinase N-terminal 7TM domain-containing diguanylate cyclase [Paenibacillus eucommiae]|uniref:Diguanylate cyclase (GGDEF)-like protein/PAS domain S-box-containing protein n=1 Tax=Paenibacillus eucommiae TaxID=1355755 RepID=A0ABS4IMK1_9BACL|nr:histidine kinase N-terminal 7TM domain-containing protein [Paenibacillus eucommiae]MBP1988785.1 diguanylate cyclase (GGDEF)-like protein/PAS domain S-box-containing protein [Paenibacillus eucommiae]
MGSQTTMYISLVAVSGVLSIFLGFYAYFRRKEISGARTFIIYIAAQVTYIFAFAFELSSDSLEEIKRWTVIEYIGISFAPVLGLKVILRYIDKPVSRTVSTLLFVIPTITMIMVSTNEFHHLFYKSMALRENTELPLTEMVIGEWYIVHGAFTFSCLLAGVVLLSRQWKKTKRAYRKQLITLICGQFLPMISAFIYLVGLTPGGIDPVPFVMSITSTMYVWAIVTTRMLTIVPIAKESIFESMREGVIVLDSADRLIDFNGAVSRMLPGLDIRMIGKKLDEVWKQLIGSPFPVIERLDGTHEEMIGTADGAAAYYQIRSSLVKSRSGEPAGSLLMLIDVTEQKQLQDQLKELAYYDGLTKIYNRTQFIHRSKELLQEAHLRNDLVSFILFDIDHFKSVNDTYGHETGDQVIIHVVSICQQVITPDILFARYGGEEFVLALPSTTLNEAGKFAEIIRTKLENTPLITRHGPITVTSSFGIAQSKEDSDTLESLLRDADAALYEAKKEGRNSVRLFK